MNIETIIQGGLFSKTHMDTHVTTFTFHRAGFTFLGSSGRKVVGFIADLANLSSKSFIPRNNTFFKPTLILFMRMGTMLVGSVKKFKVTRFIIKTITINMMHSFYGFQSPTQFLFHNYTMFQHTPITSSMRVFGKVDGKISRNAMRFYNPFIHNKLIIQGGV